MKDTIPNGSPENIHNNNRKLSPLEGDLVGLSAQLGGNNGLVVAHVQISQWMSRIRTAHQSNLRIVLHIKSILFVVFKGWHSSRTYYAARQSDTYQIYPRFEM